MRRREDGKGADKGYALLLRPHGVHAARKLLGLPVVGQLALHPDGVAVGGVGDGAGDGAVAAAAEAVVALAGARLVPVEGHLSSATEQLAGDGARLGIAAAARSLGIAPQHIVAAACGPQRVGHRLVEALQARPRQPVVLDHLKGLPRPAVALGRQHRVRQRRQRRVSAAQHEGVVARVDGGGEKRRGLGVSAGDDDEVDAWVLCQQGPSGLPKGRGTHP